VGTNSACLFVCLSVRLPTCCVLGHAVNGRRVGFVMMHRSSCWACGAFAERAVMTATTAGADSSQQHRAAAAAARLQAKRLQQPQVVLLLVVLLLVLVVLVVPVLLRVAVTIKAAGALCGPGTRLSTASVCFPTCIRCGRHGLARRRARVCGLRATRFGVTCAHSSSRCSSSSSSCRCSNSSSNCRGGGHPGDAAAYQ
jgi:hypothetical protein